MNHLDNTVITMEQRKPEEIATEETNKTKKNNDQENAPETAVLQMRASKDPKTRKENKQKLEMLKIWLEEESWKTVQIDYRTKT